MQVATKTHRRDIHRYQRDIEFVTSNASSKREIRGDDHGLSCRVPSIDEVIDRLDLRCDKVLENQRIGSRWMPQIGMLKKVRVFLTVCEAFKLEPVLAYDLFECAICKDGDPVSAPL